MCARTRLQQIKNINIGNQLKCSGHLWNAWIMWEGKKKTKKTDESTRLHLVWATCFPLLTLHTRCLLSLRQQLCMATLRTNVRTKGQWIQIFPKKQHWHLQNSPNYVLMQNYIIQDQSSPFLHHTSQSREGKTKKDYFRWTIIAWKEPITLYISCTSCCPPPPQLQMTFMWVRQENLQRSVQKQPMFAEMTGINNFNHKRSRWQSSVMIWEFFII